jgi:hypothetical protein
MRQAEFLATARDPKTFMVGQLMQDAVFTCCSRTDALTILSTSHFLACLAFHTSQSVSPGYPVSGGRPSLPRHMELGG